MNVAIIQLPHFYGSGYSRPAESYPLGLGYISNALSENHIPHEAVDLWGLQLSVEEAMEKIDFSKFTILGISSYITQYKYLKSFTKKLKEKYPDLPIICGGAGPTFSAHIILKNTGVDVCVIGEGERTIVDLIQNINELPEVKGVAYIENGEIIFTETRDYISDLDSLSFPDRKFFDFEKFIETAGSVKGESHYKKNHRKWRIADIIAGRGCPYQCAYCSKTFSGLRMRSVENVMTEIDMLVKEYGINHLLFNDELFLLSKKRVLAFCEELKKTGLTWSCQGRINLVDEEILNAMKDAGCIEIGYGVEAVSQSLLDNMNKRLKSNRIVPAIKLTQKAGIKPIIQYMYGYPGENDQTIKATVKFFKEIRHPYVGFTTTPIPGTKLYKDCLEKGIINDEEDYILRLDSGYNVSGAMINMTEFSDKEFYIKKILLEFRVNHNYYIRHPLLYLKFIYRYLWIGFNKVSYLLKRKMV